MKSFNKLFLQLLDIVTNTERNNMLTAEKTANIIERDNSDITGFVVTDKYGNVGIINKGAVKWIDKQEFFVMMQGETNEQPKKSNLCTACFKGPMIKDISSVYLTHPVKYKYTCNHCGNIEYKFD
jgi:hypothetical protein